MSDIVFPCGICGDNCVSDTIQCSDCDTWIHRMCIPMEPDILQAWSDANMNFLCKDCCFVDGEFSQAKSLKRLEAVIGAKPRDVRVVAKCEKLLLETYGVQVPTPVSNVKAEVDSVSVNILRKFQPVILEDSYPAKVTADGNCLYRAVSKAITGHEGIYILLRILTLLEILMYPMYYDSEHHKFVDLIGDNRILVGTYMQLARDAGKLGEYAEMMHIYAMSAALKFPIRSYYPPHLSSEYASQPYSRKVCGRGVNLSGIPLCTLMWTTCANFVSSVFDPNHFVPIFRKHPDSDSDIIHIDSEDYITSAQDVPISAFNSDSEDDIVTGKGVPTSAILSDSQDVPISDIHEDDESFENFIEPSTAPHPLSNGCLSNAFMEACDIIDLLMTYKSSDAHDSVPAGTKNDVFFVVSNNINLENRSKGQRSSFSDDCGIWNSSKGSTPRTYFHKLPSGALKTLYKQGDKFCNSKKVKGKQSFIPLEPQPDQVIELFRNYSVLKKDSSYKRRVSWLGSCESDCIVLVEYLGTFPGLSSHGNGKDGNEYIRTPTAVMSEMSDMLKKDNPLNVYNKLTVKHDDLSGPSNRQQVYDKKKNDKKKERKEEVGYSISRGNLADHICEIDKMLSDANSIVKTIIRDQGKAPCIILYSELQLEDLRTLCCGGQSILGVDKTFNLCDMHVTTTCYKQPGVSMETTGEPPIFLGPIFIHDNSDFDSYVNFFHHLKIKLINSTTAQMVIGTDEEQALVNAIRSAFPESKHILCIRHLKQNVKQKLIDECIDKTDRESLTDDIFGCAGLLHADDIICFETKCSDIEEKAKALSSSFHRYFENRLKGNIKRLWEEGLPDGYFDKDWTNNNCESFNHVLKRAIDWKSKPLLDLVGIVKDIIDTQFKDLKRALVDRGQFRVAETHKHFRVSKTAWTNKTDEERQRYFRRFRRFIPKDKTTVTSTDGSMTVIKPRALGKKKGQRKRKVNERTTTAKKPRTHVCDSDDSE